MAVAASAAEERVALLKVQVEAAKLAITAAQRTEEEARQRLAAAEAVLTEETRLASCVLGDLPLNCLELVFKSLSNDSRLRCRLVCRGWRALLEGRRMWVDDEHKRIDLRDDFSPSMTTDALLRAVAPRAGSLCQQLYLSQHRDHDFESVVTVVGGLKRLTLLTAICSFPAVGEGVAGLSAFQIRRLIRATPKLVRLECDAVLTPRELLDLLVRPPVPELALYTLRVDPKAGDATNLRQVIAALSPKLDGSLWFLDWHVPLRRPEEHEALLGAAISLQLRTLSWSNSTFTASMLPHLTRLLTENKNLRDLDIRWTRAADDDLPLDQALAAFCAALRASTLTDLTLMDMALWTSVPAVGGAIIDSLVDHPTLTSLNLDWNRAISLETAAAAGQALARIVDCGRLVSLSIEHCLLGDVWATPLFAAVARSKVLKTLLLPQHAITKKCAESVVLPAVKANTSLRQLVFYNEEDDEDVEISRHLAQAEGLVAARPPAPGSE